jgi:hypothetical protein
MMLTVRQILFPILLLSATIVSAYVLSLFGVVLNVAAWIVRLADVVVSV